MTTKVNKIAVFLALCVVWFIIHVSLIIYDGLSDNIQKCDVVIVLGNKVELDGTPSKRLKARLDRAVQLYHDRLFQFIIVSGGIGKEGFDESEVMKEYLINKHVPAEFIIMDNEGVNSYATALNSKRIMRQKSLKSAMIITQYFHITRTRLAFKKVGQETFSAHAEYFEPRDFYSIFREFFAYYKYFFI
ncbi:MAG: YdcF family protein [Spirochaetes bacterium]|nr:YdcF family protein [Spirochaetota bacterium]MBN2769486.1 YdcF family protein [Spirochaetota bacterium]